MDNVTGTVIDNRAAPLGSGARKRVERPLTIEAHTGPEVA
jgi:hypothetical protein